MRRSPRTKAWPVASRLALAAAVCALAALAIPWAVAHASNAGAPSSSYVATGGVLTRAGTVDPKQAAAPRAAAAKTVRSRGARPIHATTKAAATAASQVQASAGAQLDERETGALLHNFNGVGSLDSAVTNFGAEFEPPDQGLCAGNGFVIDAVNSAYTIYRPDGTVVAGPLNVNVLFDEGLTEFTSDPRCYYDRATNTWFAIILFINDTNTAARTDIAVNPTGDPTTPWTVYHLDATDTGMSGHAGCPCFGDQPLLGIDGENIYVSTNEFSILGPEFNGAQIYAISKAQLVALAASPAFVHFDNLNIGGAQAASVQPASTNGAADAEYFFSSLDPNGTGDNRIGVWAITDRRAVSQGRLPTLSSEVLTSEAYGIPPGAQQKGSTSLLDAGDDRMQQAQFINGDVWAALDTTITLPGDTSARAGIAWFRVHPRLRRNVVSGSQLAEQGYIAVKGEYVLYPAIQASSDGTAAVVMTLSGPDRFASAAYTVMHEGRRSFAPVKVVAAGTGPYDPNATRWGDYSYAVLDTSGRSVWLATEYIPPAASQTTDGRRNWGTRVFDVSLDN